MKTILCLITIMTAVAGAKEGEVPSKIPEGRYMLITKSDADVDPLIVRIEHKDGGQWIIGEADPKISGEVLLRNDAFIFSLVIPNKGEEALKNGSSNGEACHYLWYSSLAYMPTKGYCTVLAINAKPSRPLPRTGAFELFPIPAEPDQGKVPAPKHE